MIERYTWTPALVIAVEGGSAPLWCDRRWIGMRPNSPMLLAHWDTDEESRLEEAVRFEPEPAHRPLTTLPELPYRHDGEDGWTTFYLPYSEDLYTLFSEAGEQFRELLGMVEQINGELRNLLGQLPRAVRAYYPMARQLQAGLQALVRPSEPTP